jgi:predicted RNase H-like nuclease
MRVPLFTGVDSAWGGKNPGAVCDLAPGAAGGLVARPGLRARWPELVRAFAAYRGEEHHVVAIDQSLVVGNASGMRPVERLLAQSLMGRFRLGAHASNTTNPAYGPGGGLWDLLELLDAQGYRHEPMAVSRRAPGRHYFECYPHPALIGLFGLNRCLAYKRGRGTAHGWRRLVKLVRSLARKEPRVENAEEVAPLELPWTKPNEDRLDALVAAYVAAWFWFHGTARSTVAGDLRTGYMVTPHSVVSGELLLRTFGAARIDVEGTAVAARPR